MTEPGREEPNRPDPAEKGSPRFVPITLTLVALAMTIAHIIWPNIKIDAITVALLVVALLPWLGGLFESIELPGGGKVQYRKLEARLEATERRTTDVGIQVTDASSTAQAALGAATNIENADDRGTPISYRRLVEVASRYLPTRAMPSGPARIDSLNRLFGNLIATAPRVADFDVTSALKDQDPGIRLAAYARLYAVPDGEFLDEIIEALTSRENLPFSQYWAIRAISLVWEKAGPRSVARTSLQALVRFRDELPEDTDRRNELDHLIPAMTKQTPGEDRHS